MTPQRLSHSSSSPRLRILVTGGAGFLGSHLCDRLLRDDHEVLAMDDFSTGSKENVAHLLGNPRFRLVEHDITESYRYDVERIYNLACPASPIHYQRDPIKTIVTNVEGTLNGLRLASETGARFFQASTSEVYGDPLEHPQLESYWGHVNPTGPRACYDEGKRCAETLCFDFHRQAKVDIRVARIFNTYGPRMAFDDGRVVSNFIVQALRGDDVTLYGDGAQTRSFCYVDDLIDAFVRLMERPGVTGPVNLGNDKELSIAEIARLVLRVTGSKSRTVHRPAPADDPKQRRPDLSLAGELLDFHPRTSLEDGIKHTVEDFKKRLKDHPRVSDDV